MRPAQRMPACRQDCHRWHQAVSRPCSGRWRQECLRDRGERTDSSTKPAVVELKCADAAGSQPFARSALRRRLPPPEWQLACEQRAKPGGCALAEDLAGLAESSARCQNRRTLPSCHGSAQQRCRRLTRVPHQGLVGKVRRPSRELCVAARVGLGIARLLGELLLVKRGRPSGPETNRVGSFADLVGCQLGGAWARSSGKGHKPSERKDTHRGLAQVRLAAPGFNVERAWPIASLAARVYGSAHAAARTKTEFAARTAPTTWRHARAGLRGNRACERTA